MLFEDIFCEVIFFFCWKGNVLMFDLVFNVIVSLLVKLWVVVGWDSNIC